MNPVAATDFTQFAQLRADARRDDPDALRNTAKQFESLMLQQMLKSMRAASLGDDVLGGEQTQFYQDMFDAQISQHLAAGRGIGVADLLVRQLQQGREPAIGNRESSPVRPQAALPAAAAARPASDASAAPPAPRTAPSPQEFVRSVLPHAERAARELGIPARVLIAQAALETGWGRHAIRRENGAQALNFFGIKADKRWSGEEVQTMTNEYRDGRMQAERASFRAYDSVGAAFDDYVAFLRANPRYAQALRHGGDARHFVGGLQKAGYATDPDYAQKIMRIADSRAMRLALAQAAQPPRTVTV
ncbi:flagellar assembly peptidoglycan hydrolase FlgJ [Fontimonas sp. SYSU GA230001]|uniref:flagellar assembly peptidoglycan hydrolase FlgJ n=1 Tax=Fontimonas sp. SYSU GA230001 TaxID=3142450 RepID=UPI0032B5CA2A